MPTILAFHPDAAEMLGFLPTFINEDSSEPVREQLDRNYRHGGGWRPLKGWVFNPNNSKIAYPGDEPLEPIAVWQVKDERVWFYPHAWVCVVQKDGSYEVARMD